MSLNPIRLSAQGLRIGYCTEGGLLELAHDLELNLHAGELTCLLGRNGSGKSTLLRSLSGLQPLLSGKVSWNGVDPQSLTPRARARELAVVLTQLEHTGSMRVRELVALGRYPHTEWHGSLGKHDEAQIQDAMKQCGCEHLADRALVTLSDGERQRALIARALAQDTRILFLDEPTAFLDLPGRAQIMLLLRRMARERQLAILLSTHDLALALDAADRFWLIDDHKQFHEGAPEDLVLDGTLETVFARDGITLNPRTAALHLSVQSTRKIRVEKSSGVRSHWLLHALRRHGFDITDDSAWSIKDHQTHWELIKEDARENFEHLGVLMRALRNSKTHP